MHFEGLPLGEIAGQLGVCGQHFHRVAGHLDLRNDGDIAFFGVSDEIAHFLLGVIASGAAVSIGESRAHCGQFRVPLDFQPPALVIRQVQVENVQFVQRHAIDTALDIVQGQKGTATIQHQTPPGEARAVPDAHARHFHTLFPRPVRFAFRRKHLAQRLDAVEQSRHCDRANANTIRRDHHLVAFWPQCPGRSQRQEYGVAPAAPGCDVDWHCPSRGARQQSAQLLANPPGPAVLCFHIDCCARTENKNASMDLHPGRLRDDCKRRSGIVTTDCGNAGD